MFGKSKAKLKKERDYPSAAEVANVFIKLAERDGKTLNNLQLQKLVYIAYGFSQGILGKPLFHDNIQAWALGPVIPNLYHQLKKYGWGDVTDYIETKEEISDGDPAIKIIEAVRNSYGQFTGEELSALTHQDDTPWSSVWEPGIKDIEIPDEIIQRHYREKLAHVQ